MRKWKPGLLGKAALALAVAALLPMSLAAYRLIQVNREALSSQVLSLHAVAARTAADRVAAFLTSRMALATTAANHPGLYLDPQSEEARLFLTDLLSAPNGMETLAIAVVDQGGDELIRAQRRDVGMQANRLFWTHPGNAPVLARDQGNLWLVAAAALPERDASLRMIFNANQVLDMLRPEEVGRSANLALGGSERDVLLGSVHTTAEAPPELLAHALSGKISGAGQYRTPSGGKVLGAYAPVPGAAWYVMSWQPLVVAEAVASAMRRRSFEAVGLAVVLTGILATLAFYSVVRPLRQLAARQNELAGAEPGRGDEIDQLKSSFEALGRSLREREALDEIFLGRYQVLRRVGQGAMGAVFEAWDPKLQRTVALKTIRFDQYVDAERKQALVDRLLREAITAGRVGHANVVGVYDLESSDDVAFVAMEYVDGSSLDEYLTGDRRLTPQEAAALGVEIARGLAAAHARNVIHRDIKPANVLLSSDHAVKVADFGLSEFVTNLAGQKDAIFGTPGYIPPETLGGLGFSAAGDIFALGVLMFRCLTGRMPFPGDTNMQVMVATISKNPTPPKELVPDMPDALNDLVVDMLSRQKEKRPTATEAAEILDRIRQGLTWRYAAPHVEDQEETAHETEIRSQLLETVRFSDSLGDRSPS